MKQQTFCLRWFSGFVCIVFSTSLVPPVFGQTPVTYNGRPAAPEEILVRLRSNAPAALARARSVVPSAVIENLSPGLALHLVRAPGNSLQGLLRAFSNHPDVLYAEPNYIVRAVTTVPNDLSFPALWGMTKISAPASWDVTTGGTSAVLGIVDTGIDYNHPDLAGNIWNAPSAFTVTIQGRAVHCPAGSHGFNALTFTCDPMDDHGHGTHVAGIVGATGNNSIGVAGVNWRAQVMGLKFITASGIGPISAAVNAMEFAIQVKALFGGTATPADLRVLSNSWGSTSYSQSLSDEVNKANANEILFVAAAGNDSQNNDASPVYPAGLSMILPNVIAVAATDSGDGLAGFSNYGANSVQLGAPGVAIYSTVPSGGYTELSGTSMATPHVAGAALLTLAACPSLSTAALKAALLSNVDPVPALSGKTTTGGRLNANRAVRSCGAPTALKATFLGTTGQDLVGPGGSLTPNGVVDWRIKLEGLRGTPTRARITSGDGGVWEAPFNGVNWLVATQFIGGGTGDVWFEPWANPTGFHVKVWYADSGTDEVDVVSSEIPSTLHAIFLGVTGEDFVEGGGSLSPNGVGDWRVHLQGLRGEPSKVRVTSGAGGVWEGPFNGMNWVVATQLGPNGEGELWFEPWAGPSGLHVKVWYSDGTTDDADAVVSEVTSTLKASYAGATGEDFAGPGVSLSPSGIPDWHIRLEGLRGPPVTVLITASIGGHWESPFNGTNWLIASQYAGDGNGDLWFEPWSSPSVYHVKVWYMDGTTDEADTF